MAADDELQADVGRHDSLQGPRRRTQLITLAAAGGVLVLGLAVAVAWLLIDGEDAVEPAAAPAPTVSSSAAAPAPSAETPTQHLTCPGSPPVAPVAVEGFDSPEFLTTAPAHVDPIPDGQLVVGWTDADGTVLLARWPAATGPDGSGVSCDAVQLTIDLLSRGSGASWTYDPATTTFDDALAALLATVDADAAGPGTPTVRFNGSRDVDQLPAGARPCEGGEEGIPNESGGPSSTAPAATPEEVVATFLTRRAWDTTGGFTQLVDPDGSVVYVVPVPGTSDLPGAHLAVVWVAETPEGWIVDRWEISGC